MFAFTDTKKFSLGLAELCLQDLSRWAQDLATESGKQEEVFLCLLGREKEGVDVSKYSHKS